MGAQGLAALPSTGESPCGKGPGSYCGTIRFGDLISLDAKKTALVIGDRHFVGSSDQWAKPDAPLPIIVIPRHDKRYSQGPEAEFAHAGRLRLYTTPRLEIGFARVAGASQNPTGRSPRSQHEKGALGRCAPGIQLYSGRQANGS